MWFLQKVTRRLAENGVIAYPYSMREAVAVARHLEKYQKVGSSGVEKCLAPQASCVFDENFGFRS